MANFYSFDSENTNLTHNPNNTTGVTLPPSSSDVTSSNHPSTSGSNAVGMSFDDILSRSTAEPSSALYPSYSQITIPQSQTKAGTNKNDSSSQSFSFLSGLSRDTTDPQGSGSSSAEGNHPNNVSAIPHNLHSEDEGNKSNNPSNPNPNHSLSASISSNISQRNEQKNNNNSIVSSPRKGNQNQTNNPNNLSTSSRAFNDPNLSTASYFLGGQCLLIARIALRRR